MKKYFNNKLIHSLFGLTILILVCGFLARYLTNSETLADYAEKNPDIALADNQIASSENNTSHIDKTTEQNQIPEENHMAFEEKEPVSITKENSFYYEDLSDELIARITGISYPMSKEEADTFAIPAINILSEGETALISYDDLCYLSVLHYNFNGEVQKGELICNKKIADDFIDIFYELYTQKYPIEKMKLIDEYNGDDTASMADNNTSCFNYRVVDGTSSLSKHALGCAIDINPFYNPYVVFHKNGTGETYISPSGSEIYADRSNSFPYKIDENDLCYKLFKEHGFTWGGDWNSCKDYQHFQKVVE